MNVFVTGGSGFVGGHVIEKLVAAGHTVTALARSQKSARVVEGYGATAIDADLGTIAPRDLAGVDVVVHAAARAEEWGTREEFFEANVEGTKRILEAAKGAKVPRFVFIGTEAALFDGHDLRDVDESAPYPVTQAYLYSASKAEAEKLVLAANGAAMTTLSIRPRFVWGPRDASVLPVIVRMATEKKFAFIDGGRAETSTTHVANLVHAIELALTRGEGGRAYFVADDGTRTLRAFLTALAATRGVALPDKSMPKTVARVAASVVEAIYRWFRLKGHPPITRFTAAMMSSTVTVRTDRARRELGYVPVVSVEDGLRELAGERVAAPTQREAARSKRPLVSA